MHEAISQPQNVFQLTDDVHLNEYAGARGPGPILPARKQRGAWLHRLSLTKRWTIVVLAWVLIALGAVLGTGGGGLWLLRGSPYYFLVGAALVASGLLIRAGRVIGVWIFLIAYASTIVWALWEAGLDGWALFPRVVTFTILLPVVTAILPSLDRRFGRRIALSGLLTALAIFVLLGVAISVSTRPVVSNAFPPAAPAPTIEADTDWPSYGGTYGARRYSSLGQINASNVERLKPVWVAHTRDLPEEKAAAKKYGAETTPIKVGDSLYLCSAKNILISLDPATGKERWRYDPKVADEWIPYTAACRGVTYFAVSAASRGEHCAARIIEGTLDGRLIAVDAAKGTPCSGFGNHGAVDIKKDLGKVSPGMVSITSPPTIVRGVIVTGHQVLDGQERFAPSGVIRGYDAISGELRWAWDMMHPERSGPPPEGETYTRGTPNMWTTASADEALGLVYIPLGNSAADYWSSSRRPREKQYSTSLVALDATTGRPVWSFQTVHNDVWDYDLGAHATLIDFPVGNRTVPALVLPTKQGAIYVLDRSNGTVLTGVHERPVPQGGAEPLQRSAMQPFSLYHTLRKLPINESMMWGISPVDQLICRIQFRWATYQGIYTPPVSSGHSIQYPGYNGGVDWGGVAVDPMHGIIVANYNDMPNYNRLVPRAEAEHLGWAPRSEARGKFGGAEGSGDPQMGTPYAIDVNAGWRLPFTKLLCKEPPYGGIRAIELRSGKTIWDRPLGTARNNGPFGIPSRLPFTIGTPNNGGSVVTAGGLIFIAATTDDLLRAIDLRTGRTLWSDVLPAGGQATPMTYSVDGRQYVVIMAGGHHFMETPIGDSLVAYALP